VGVTSIEQGPAISHQRGEEKREKGGNQKDNKAKNLAMSLEG